MYKLNGICFYHYRDECINKLICLILSNTNRLKSITKVYKVDNKNSV